MNHLLGNRCAFFIMRGEGGKKNMQRRMIVKKREGQEKQNEEGNFKGDLNTKSFFFFYVLYDLQHSYL